MCLFSTSTRSIKIRPIERKLLLCHLCTFSSS
uniref:Uncharacterized protein n=1 Tax=Siphoviridae sp. ctYKh4 TaxID=2823586 RepID=A0A8S5LCI2_9CAUD|nr:MAG TPA: hypothetical protein [Siphoviridae sp. ctYKh4]